MAGPRRTRPHPRFNEKASGRHRLPLHALSLFRILNFKKQAGKS
jgi:hypothetical protein